MNRRLVVYSICLILVSSLFNNISLSQEKNINENYIKIMQNYIDFIKNQKDIKFAYYYGSRAKIGEVMFDTNRINNLGQKIVFYKGNDLYSDIDTKVYTTNVEKYFINTNWINKICEVCIVANKIIPATQDSIVQIICKNGNSIDVVFSKIKPDMCYDEEKIKKHSVFVNKLKNCNNNEINKINNKIDKKKFKNDISIFFIDALNAKINLIRGDKIRLVNAKLKMDRLKVSFYRMVEIYTNNYDYKSILDIQNELPNIEQQIESKLNKREMMATFERLLDASIYIIEGICKKNAMNDILPIIDEFKKQYDLIN